MNFSENYPVWSTGENAFNVKKVSQYVNLTGRNDHNSNNAVLNTSQVPAWDNNDSSWVQQNDFYKTVMETDSLNSGGESQEHTPAWASSGAESQGNTPTWAPSLSGDAQDSMPAWASNPTTWDHDSATRLAQKLLQVQTDTAYFGGMDESAKNKSPMMSEDHQDAINGQFISPTPNPRFKTEFCRNFREKGECIYGNQCQFAHGKAEIRQDMIRHNKYKTKLCQKYWIKGWCAYGTRCNFIHQEEEQTVAEKTRVVVHQSGFRPLLPPIKSLRKSSESSADSGVEVGNLAARGIEVGNLAARGVEVGSLAARGVEVGNLYRSMPADLESNKRPKFEFPLNVNCMEFKSEVASSAYQNGNQWNDIKVKGNLEKESDLFNMNLASELNRNLYLDVVKVKESRTVPHPEDNPIPVCSNSLPFNQSINGQYRMMKSTTNTWPF